MEVSDTQVALTLLNTTVEISSDSYRYFGAEYCVNFFEHFHSLDNLQPTSPVATDDDSVSSCQSGIDSNCSSYDSFAPSSINCFNSEEVLVSATQHTPSATDKNFGPAPFYNVKMPSSDDCSDGDFDDAQVSTKWRVPVHYPKPLVVSGQGIKTYHTV